MADEEQDHRAVLEDAAQVLDAARRRYSELLRSGRLRRPSTALIREAALHEPAVEQALSRLGRRARAERWSDDEPALQEARELRAMQQKLAEAISPEVKSGDLGSALEHAWHARVRASGPVKSALVALPASDPDTAALDGFARVLEAATEALADPSAPPARRAMAALAAIWSDAESARRDAWQRLERADRSGAVARYLRRRNAAASFLPHTGPARLLRAEAARAAWLGSAQRLLHERLSPLPVREAELAAVVHWLVERERMPAAPLASVDRAPLLELAWALNRSFEPQGLTALARRADACAHPDAAKLLERLQLHVAALRKATEPATPPLLRKQGPASAGAPQTLAEAVSELAALTSR